MKRTGGLLEQIADPDNLRLAFWKARKGKDQSKQVREYRDHLEERLLELRRQILFGNIAVGEYRCFEIFDPKRRQICAAPFSEQVLHHALMNVCHDYFEKKQIFDSYASRPAKGAQAAVKRAQLFSRSCAWFLKLDVRKFFASIHHERLKEQLRRMFKDWRLLEIFEAIIDSCEDSLGRGVPIGNLSSQYFANHYLTELDHFIKEKLYAKKYVRYMDDMVLWHDDKTLLKEWHQEVKVFVRNILQCELKPELLNRTELGVPFLGYRIFPFYIRLLQRSKARFVRKMRHIDQQHQSGAWSEKDCQRRVLPLAAFTALADAAEFRRNVMATCCHS
ncbi:RNA-directed DNA polymerase [Candidatus Electronema sp. JC]|uniref:RNA-directed DNA polymerase n=1 Tax=Candidatus Electronema sp. JC TaxID=3401570 RepID=UPI003AA83B89